jgi:hypothetical protein
MLGAILGGLTDQARAEALLVAVADREMLARVRAAAEGSGVTAGAYVAATVRHLLDHGSGEIWLDLVSRMSNAPNPGVAALEAILARAFPASRGKPSGGAAVTSRA